MKLSLIVIDFWTWLVNENFDIFFRSFHWKVYEIIEFVNEFFYDFNPIQKSITRDCHKNVFLLAGHKVDFIAPCGANKSTFWPYSRKKIVCNTGKTFILLVWLLPLLCSGIKLHTRKINFFFPSCTMYYYSHSIWIFPYF